jgi:hypothetical protein
MIFKTISGYVFYLFDFFTIHVRQFLPTTSREIASQTSPHVSVFRQFLPTTSREIASQDKRIIYPYLANEKNVIVSMTTIPSRSRTILPTILSILRQTIVPDVIFIGIPLQSMREPDTEYSFPESVLHCPNIHIVYYEKDLGPIMKLTTGLDVNDNPLHKRIITMDDDTVYEKHCIETLLQMEPNVVCCLIGRDHTGKKIYGNQPPCIVKSLEGYGGVLYDPLFFEKDFLQYTTSFAVRMNDDLAISHYLDRKKILIKKKQYFVCEPLNTFLFLSRFSNPLWLQNKKDHLFEKAEEELGLFSIME